MKHKEKKMKIIKLIAFILVLLLLIAITVELFPMFRDLSTLEGRIKFKENIDTLGFKGVFAILGLMFAQVLFAILPGEPIELLAGMCYGAIGGMLIIFLGAFISSLLIFFAVRKFGRGFIYSFVSKEKIDKIEHSKLLSDPKKLYFTLFLLFFIPGTPKDLIVYLGGLLPVKPMKFLLISTFARFPSIISSTIAGSNIIAGNWLVIVGVYIVTFAISGLIYLFFRKRNKEITML